jgi:hypothetical protein
MENQDRHSRRVVTPPPQMVQTPPVQNGKKTPPRERLQSPNRKHGLIGYSPDSKYYHKDATKGIQNGLTSVCTNLFYSSVPVTYNFE